MTPRRRPTRPPATSEKRAADGVPKPLPEHRAVIDLHGHDVAYRRAGAGAAIVLVHGIAGSNTTWDELLPVLAKTHDVIAPDLPGHGASGSSAGDYSVGAMAATLRDLLMALGIGSA